MRDTDHYLQKIIQFFFPHSKKYENNGDQILALQLLCGIDFLDSDLSSEKKRAAIVERIKRGLRAERFKGLQKHWSYNLNRHIALKQAQNKLTS